MRGHVLPGVSQQLRHLFRPEPGGYGTDNLCLADRYHINVLMVNQVRDESFVCQFFHG